MSETFDSKMLDKRVVQRFIKRGQLPEKEYERHIKSLPDLAEQSAPVEATMESMHVGTGGSHPEEE